MLRRSLLTRLLIASATVAVCSIAATAWLAVQGTSKTIRQQQGQALAADQKIYDRLLQNASERPIWDAGTESLIKDLEKETGRRITLTSETRHRVAGTDVNPLPVKASAVINPLDVNGFVDPRVVGPFQLTGDEQAALRQKAESLLSCMSRINLYGVIVTSPGGRPRVELPGTPTQSVHNPCPQREVGMGDTVLNEPTATEEAALRQLQPIYDRCMDGKGGNLLMSTTGSPMVSPKVGGERARKCLNDSKVTLLDPYVAPQALLFITDAEGTPDTPGLTKAGTARIIGAALAVLVLTILVSFLVATRLVKPLKQLTVAAQRMRAGDTQARVRTKATGEIGEVAEAFNEMAEHLARTEEQRKAMISDVSHELRTPVGNIRGWLIATQDGVADLDGELVTSLLEETLLLQHLVDDLQQLALADAGELKIHPERIDLGEVVDQFVAHDRVTVRKSGDLNAMADPIRIRQVIGNLVTNALKHSEDEVVLTARRIPDAVEITVEDSGTGIAEPDLPRVFERFWRADKSRSRQTGGSGLGLAIVKQLVELHGGSAGVTSGNGNTTFTVKLPA
ncbi:two-component sensor histidine kinase [Lentzea sp. NBRC 105346]|uniref:sensor histidine kinase n=1 Tax=Lentzea sp. NBRC 105346 TaxID=3032205 RepID=UPI0025577A42|nr:ATP-binding protein [Lentzea sp. NBRC 105346]GLZ30456.1 two-component sensor histidine kinase [Lentzea sp. NBRC 105346]